MICKYLCHNTLQSSRSTIELIRRMAPGVGGSSAAEGEGAAGDSRPLRGRAARKSRGVEGVLARVLAPAWKSLRTG